MKTFCNCFKVFTSRGSHRLVHDNALLVVLKVPVCTVDDEVLVLVE
jgi:hypothetical protein